ncbi:MAG TPA: hypothetical protein PK829_05725 [Promineifilum sp.]|nr:hypothetical protein [Promineifilum sp.]
MRHSLARIAVIVGLVAVGLWLAVRASMPAPESSARRAALSAFAPGRPLAPASSAELAPQAGTAAPTTVVLANVPTGVDPADSLYARWQRGEVDLTETEGLLPPAEVAALQEAALSLPPMPPQAAPPSTQAPVPGAGWASLDYNDGSGVPPDPELAVGPNHVIAAVNSSFEIYNKSGALVGGPYGFASFLSEVPNCVDFDFDPNAIYDEAADRYVLGIDINGEYYCLAVSATNNPLGNWHVYAFPVGSAAEFFDYPHAGVGDQYIFAGANIFTSSFLESRVYAFDKGDMYAGNPADWASRALPTTEDTPIPLHLHGWAQGTWNTGANHYFLTDYNYNGATYRVWRWSNPLSSAPTAVGVVDLEDYTGVVGGYPIDAPQSGSSARLQANDFRPQDFEYRNGYAWTAYTFSCNPGGGTVNCVRWAKIDPATATIADAGVLATAGQHRIFPNLAVNRCDDMAVGYTKTSASSFPGVFATGRQASDPAGTLQAETQLQAGTITYTAFDGSPHRWGDYTGMTIDPDGETFWYLGEYSKNTGTSNGRWATYVRSLAYETCGGGPGPTQLSVDLSAKAAGAAGGVAFAANDIIHYDGATDTWSMLFDASDVGITKNVTAFYRQDNAATLDTFYLVLAANQNVPGVGTVTPNDVIRFTPTSLGSSTAGSFALYFDGSDVGLTTTAEHIDALGMDGSRLLISTTGAAKVPRGGGGSLNAPDEDVIAFTPTSTGATTAGTWAAFFDGSTVPGLAVEDVAGFWDNPANGNLVISVLNAFNLSGVTGDNDDLIGLTPSGGSYTPSIVWNGDDAGFNVAIDAFEIVP